MKDLEYGKGYRYAHDDPAGVADMTCLPESHLVVHPPQHPRSRRDQQVPLLRVVDISRDLGDHVTGTVKVAV